MEKIKRINPAKIFRKEQCYHISEYIDFFESYFDIEIENYNGKFAKRYVISIVDSDINILFICFNDIDYPDDIKIEYYSSKDNKYKEMTWKHKDDNTNMSWYIVNYKESSYIEISKKNIFEIILNFITENENRLSIQTKREIKLRQLLI